MKQTRADTGLALTQSLLLHAGVLALLFIGLRWSSNALPDAAQGDPIEAELISASDLSPAMQRALRRAPETPKPVREPKPLPEPLPEATPAPTPRQLPPPVPDPAPLEQARVQRDAVQPPLPEVRREQEARRRQPPQVELDAQRETEMERQRQRQIEDLRRQRAQAARAASMAEQRAQQLADARGAVSNTPPARSQPTPGAGGTDPGLLARYRDALQRAIVRQWTRPDSVPLGQRCRISIRQLPGGDVISVEIDPSCPYDAQGRRSVEAAVLKAAPLPYAGFETVFNRNLELNFEAADQ
ncbi:cell envelope integrity protein TolA [Thermomonas sp.]|uniref:cell envelope integrity protein TolA n=3 Tax=Thermomonas sp. TaxID=1971895 RepID=UPI0026386B90|nr:cell envelope integrity protein TolA [Thermomonas sp.]MCO5055634.1 cell envelope integrity protein TolA [Thermomonas sp.]